MPDWKLYFWDDFGGDHYPWSFPTDMPHGAYGSSNVRLERLEDPMAQAEARTLGLDPAQSFAAVLTRPWKVHPQGARVVFDHERVAIELRNVDGSQPG